MIICVCGVGCEEQERRKNERTAKRAKNAKKKKFGGLATWRLNEKKILKISVTSVFLSSPYGTVANLSPFSQ